MRALYLIPGLVCLFLGAVFLLVFRSSRVRQEVSERSMTAQAWAKLAGTGSRPEYDYENRSHIVHYGIYEYDTADGQHISSASDFGYYDPKDIPGTRGNMVKVRYNPREPAEFALSEEQAVAKTIWPKFKKTGILLTFLGIVLTAAGVAAILGLFDSLPDSLLSQAEDGSFSFNILSGTE